VINHRDVRARAAEWALENDVVEKEHVLGWVLAGIGTPRHLGLHGRHLPQEVLYVCRSPSEALMLDCRRHDVLLRVRPRGAAIAPDRMPAGLASNRDDDLDSRIDTGGGVRRACHDSEFQRDQRPRR